MNYCKLYIDVENDIEELQARIDDNVQIFFEPGFVDVVVFRNEHYQIRSDIDSSTYPADRPRYHAEIAAASDRELEKPTFESAIAQLVTWLRTECEYVVASCEFENQIVEQTGWNWMLQNRLPPR